MKALGMIEVYGYLTAVEALDSALKAANVTRLDVVKVRGGLVTVLVEGDVGAVKAAMDASAAAAERIGTVVSVHVIPRPASDVERMLKGPGGGPKADPPKAEPEMGMPMTGRMVRAATAPARCAAMPAAQIKTWAPFASSSAMICSVLSGVRWAEEMVMRLVMPRSFRTDTQGATFSSSEADPMRMTTCAMEPPYSLYSICLS